MFDRYILGSHSLTNVSERGSITGFSLKVRIAYYRGLNLSMVEGFDVTVDGRSFPPQANLFTLRGTTYTFAQMESEYTQRWEMIEEATITIPHPGGLAPGVHSVQIVEYLRVSYVPVTVTGKLIKSLELT